LDFLCLRVPGEIFSPLIVRLIDQYDLKFATGFRVAPILPVKKALDRESVEIASVAEGNENPCQLLPVNYELTLLRAGLWRALQSSSFTR
jgi:hypothetical protein